MTFTNTTLGPRRERRTRTRTRPRRSRASARSATRGAATGCCRTSTTRTRRPAPHPGATGGNPGDCSSCHKHATAFKPSGCAGCHGNGDGLLAGQRRQQPDALPGPRRAPPGAHDGHRRADGLRRGAGELHRRAADRDLRVLPQRHDRRRAAAGTTRAATTRRTRRRTSARSTRCGARTRPTAGRRRRTRGRVRDGHLHERLGVRDTWTATTTRRRRRGYEWYGATATRLHHVPRRRDARRWRPRADARGAHGGVGDVRDHDDHLRELPQLGAGDRVGLAAGRSRARGTSTGRSSRRARWRSRTRATYPTAFGSCGANACHNDGNGAAFAPVATYTWGTAIAGCGVLPPGGADGGEPHGPPELGVRAAVRDELRGLPRVEHEQHDDGGQAQARQRADRVRERDDDDVGGRGAGL